MSFPELLHSLHRECRYWLDDLQDQAGSGRHVLGPWSAEDALRYDTAMLLALVAFVDWTAIHKVTPDAGGVLSWTKRRGLKDLARDLLSAALPTATQLVNKARVLSGALLTCKADMPTCHTSPRLAIRSFCSDNDIFRAAPQRRISGHLGRARGKSNARRARRRPRSRAGRTSR